MNSNEITPAQREFVINAKTIKGSPIQVDLSSERIIMSNGDCLDYFKVSTTPEKQIELHFKFNNKASRTVLDKESTLMFNRARDDYYNNLDKITLHLGTKKDGSGNLVWTGSIRLGTGEILKQCYDLIHKYPISECVNERQILNVLNQLKKSWQVFNETPEQRLKQAQAVIDNTHIDVVNLYNELGGDLDLLEFGKEHDFWAALCAYREAVETVSDIIISKSQG